MQKLPPTLLDPFPTNSTPSHIGARNQQTIPTSMATFSVGSASESCWLQPMLLVLTVHSWPAPACVGGLQEQDHTFPHI